MNRTLFTAAAAAVALALAGPALAADAVPQNDLLNATLWVSNSVEYKANSESMFQLARIRLDQALADKSWSAIGQTGAENLPPAIIADVDETLFDNGGYESWLVKAGKDYSGKTYDAWTKAMEARAVPGAVDFLKYADSKGVKIFYVTNRDATQEEATRKNAEALGFPMGGNVDTWLMSKEKEDWTSKKGTRRDFVGKEYRVLLLLGDNWGDFSDAYSGSEADRLKDYEANKAHIGHDWIVIANPEYGSFESAPFLGDYKKSADERRRLKIDALPAWKGPAE
ncbi:MAG TPA: HAD family acid phosphatase [Bauldia sp.]|nr:HAD family acid phosphatase [Bauldia sp.]